MKHINHRHYDALEGAIIHGRRLALKRRGTEFVVVPTRIRFEGTREVLDATHPTTGEEITLFIDELESMEVVF